MNEMNRILTGVNELDKISWLPINDHLEQCISSRTFKFFNSPSLVYMNDPFKQAGNFNFNTRKYCDKLNQNL